MSTTAEQRVPVGNRRQRRSYDAARREKKDFATDIELKAEDRAGNEVKEVFVAHPGRIPGAVLINFMNVGVYNDSEGMWDLFRCAFDTEPPEGAKEDTPAEYDRFRDFVMSPEYVVEADTLSQIVMDMVEDASAFPTTPPSR